MRKFFSILTLLALALGFTACEGTENPTPAGQHEVEISADKSVIMANGEDVVRFTVKVDGEAKTEDVSIIMLNTNTTLGGLLFATTEPGEYRFVAAYGKNTSEVLTITAQATEVVYDVVLEADKSAIEADNADTVTFTVKVDGEQVTEGYVITNLNTNTTIDGNTFATDAAGEYRFQASFDGKQSNQVVVTATAVEAPVQKSLTIEASKLRIQADGQDCATFSVMYGEEDVTATCEIRTTAGDVIEGGSFATTTPGSYNIYALYDNVRSNTISIDAYDPNAAYAYEIGQIYDINGTKGVAYAIKTVGNDTFAYFFSMDEADLQWSTENVWCNCISSKGAWNTYDPFDERYSQADGGVRDINNYPAFKWCMDHGADWFMPSSQELQWMWDAISAGTHNFDSESVKAYNKLLTDNGGMPFCETYYWSSNETAEDLVELVAFMADSVVCLEPYKSYTYTVRAVYRILL